MEGIGISGRAFPVSQSEMQNGNGLFKSHRGKTFQVLVEGKTEFQNILSAGAMAEPSDASLRSFHLRWIHG